MIRVRRELHQRWGRQGVVLIGSRRGWLFVKLETKAQCLSQMKTLMAIIGKIRSGSGSPHRLSSRDYAPYSKVFSELDVQQSRPAIAF